MKLRPRYSLLTLLVLTTLIAGGVKLWYGPHHVVEERSPGRQLEYTYTRDWRGKKIVEGPSTVRIYDPNQTGLYIAVAYFKNDQQIPCCYVMFKRGRNAVSNGLTSGYKVELLDQLPLSAAERLEFRTAIERERPLIESDPGRGLVWFEWFDGLQMMPAGQVNEFSHFHGVYEHLLDTPWEELVDR